MANLSQSYFGGLDTIVKGCEPALKGVGRWNFELMALMTQRAQAWAEIPVRLGQCRTPQDLVREQMQFWQAAMIQYSAGSQRLALALGACSVPGLHGPGGGKTPAPRRDYITFAEPGPETANRGDRRAA
jgi:hypothetical protein